MHAATRPGRRRRTKGTAMVAQQSNAQDTPPVAAPLARRFRNQELHRQEMRQGLHRASDTFLTVAVVRRIKRALADGVSVAELAQAHGVHINTIYDIRSGRTWSDVDVTDGPVAVAPRVTDETPYLVAMARAGDAEAMTELIIRHENPIYAHCYRLLADPDQAADTCQDVLVKAWRALPATALNTNFNAWIYRIATNACLDILRRRQRLRWLPWEPYKHDPLRMTAAGDDPEGAAVSHEDQITVRRVLARMTARHRLALVLREYRGMGCVEVGQVLGIGRSAAKSCLFRARLEFRRVYAAIEAERGAA